MAGKCFFVAVCTIFLGGCVAEEPHELVSRLDDGSVKVLREYPSASQCEYGMHKYKEALAGTVDKNFGSVAGGLAADLKDTLFCRPE